MLILEMTDVKREENWSDLFHNFPHQEKCTVIYKNLILSNPPGANRLPNGHQTSYRAYLDKVLFNKGTEYTKHFLSCNHFGIRTSNMDQYKITLCYNCGV